MVDYSDKDRWNNPFYKKKRLKFDLPKFSPYQPELPPIYPVKPIQNLFKANMPLSPKTWATTDKDGNPLDPSDPNRKQVIPYVSIMVSPEALPEGYNNPFKFTFKLTDKSYNPITYTDIVEDPNNPEDYIVDEIDLYIDFVIKGSAIYQEDYDVPFDNPSDYSIDGDPNVGYRGSILLPAGQSSTELWFTSINDDSEEEDETIIVALTPTPNYFIYGGFTSAKATIVSRSLIISLSAYSPVTSSVYPDEIVIDEANTSPLEYRFKPLLPSNLLPPTNSIIIRFLLGGIATYNQDYIIPPYDNTDSSVYATLTGDYPISYSVSKLEKDLVTAHGTFTHKGEILLPEGYLTQYPLSEDNKDTIEDQLTVKLFLYPQADDESDDHESIFMAMAMSRQFYRLPLDSVISYIVEIVATYKFKVFTIGVDIALNPILKLQGFGLNNDITIENSVNYERIGLVNTGAGHIAIARLGDTYLFDIDGVQTTKELTPADFGLGYIPSFAWLGFNCLYSNGTLSATISNVTSTSGLTSNSFSRYFKLETGNFSWWGNVWSSNNNTVNFEEKGEINGVKTIDINTTALVNENVSSPLGNDFFYDIERTYIGNEIKQFRKLSPSGLTVDNYNFSLNRTINTSKSRVETNSPELGDVRQNVTYVESYSYIDSAEPYVYDFASVDYPETENRTSTANNTGEEIRRKTYYGTSRIIVKANWTEYGNGFSPDTPKEQVVFNVLTYGVCDINLIENVVSLGTYFGGSVLYLPFPTMDERTAIEGTCNQVTWNRRDENNNLIPIPVLIFENGSYRSNDYYDWVVTLNNPHANCQHYIWSQAGSKIILGSSPTGASVATLTIDIQNNGFILSPYSNLQIADGTMVWLITNHFEYEANETNAIEGTTVYPIFNGANFSIFRYARCHQTTYITRTYERDISGYTTRLENSVITNDFYDLTPYVNDIIVKINDSCYPITDFSEGFNFEGRFYAQTSYIEDDIVVGENVISVYCYIGVYSGNKGNYQTVIKQNTSTQINNGTPSYDRVYHPITVFEPVGLDIDLYRLSSNKTVKYVGTITDVNYTTSTNSTTGEVTRNYTGLTVNLTSQEEIDFICYDNSYSEGIFISASSDYTRFLLEYIQSDIRKVNCYEQDGKMRIAIASKPPEPIIDNSPDTPPIIVPISTDIGIGDTLTGVIPASGVRDNYYKLVLDNPTYVTIRLSGLEIDINLYLYKQTDMNNSIGSSYNSGTEDEVITLYLSARTYYIKVSGNGVGASNYSLTVELGKVYADIYEFDTVGNKFIRIGNDESDLSMLDSESEFISYHP